MTAMPVLRTDIQPIASAIKAWGPDKIETLISMIRSGSSYKEVGLAVGRSRNAVAGMKYRLSQAGVFFPARPAEETTKTMNKARSRARRQLKEKAIRDDLKAARKRKEKTMKKKRVAHDDNVVHLRARVEGNKLTPLHLQSLPLSENPKTLLDLGYRECRAPVGQDPLMGKGVFKARLFCAEPTEEGEPYCDHHASLFYKAKPAATAKGMILPRIGTTMGGA